MSTVNSGKFVGRRWKGDFFPLLPGEDTGCSAQTTPNISSSVPKVSGTVAFKAHLNPACNMHIFGSDDSSY